MNKIVRVLIAVALAAVAAPIDVSASPVPEPVELWLMNSDGSGQRPLHQPEGFPGVQAGPSWSPDGTEIALTTDDLVAVPVAGGSPRTIAVGGSSRFLSWAPDGSWIAFEKPFEQPRGLFLVRPDGGDAHHIGPDAQVVTDPAWSPDATRIAIVTGTDPFSPFILYVVDVADGTFRAVGADAAPESPTWSPDGDRLAYVNGSRALVVSDMAGTDTVIARGVSSPDWSPDGSKIALSTTEGLVGLNPDGSGSIVLAPGGSGARWSADGSRLAYSYEHDIYSVQRDGAGITNLTNTDGYNEDTPRWSPDGASIAYLSEPAPFIPPDETIESEIRLRTRGHLTFRGRVVAAGSSYDPCQWVRRRVVVQQRKRWGWTKIARTRTGEEGRYRVEVRDRQGRFRAVVRKAVTYGEGGNQITCTAARSRVVRHRH